ncbi:UNVERIFIED_CONTAM: hypothetical protein RMT77_001653 [Armadillidium vulgare]
MSDKNQQKSPPGEKEIETCDVPIPKKKGKGEVTDFTTSSSISGEKRAKESTSFTEEKSPRGGKDASDKEKNKKGLEITLKKFCLHKLFPIPTVPANLLQKESDIRNLRVKVLQHGKCGLTRFVMESPVPKQAQLLPNEEIEWIGLPKEKLWTKCRFWSKNNNVAITVKLVEQKKRFIEDKRKTIAVAHRTVFPCSYPEPGDFVINLAYKDTTLPNAILTLNLKNSDKVQVL